MAKQHVIMYDDLFFLCTHNISVNSSQQALQISCELLRLQELLRILKWVAKLLPILEHQMNLSLIDFLVFELQGRVWLLFWQTNDLRSVKRQVSS